MKLGHVLQKAECGEPLSSHELQFLLELNKPDELNQVFELACRLRDRYFQNKVFLYGFIYFSTWCRNDCTFCYYRKSNMHPNRYRKSEVEVLEAAKRVAESGVHLIDLTLGEDPFYYKRHGFGSLVKLVKVWLWREGSCRGQRLLIWRVKRGGVSSWLTEISLPQRGYL